MEKRGGEGDTAVDRFNLADREELSSYRRGFKGYYPILASAPFICDVKVYRANNLWIIFFSKCKYTKINISLLGSSRYVSRMKESL